jgi:hypothetical protein
VRPPPRPSTRLDHVVAIAIGVAAVAVLLATVDGVGFTRDEGYYFRAGDLYRGWLARAVDGLVHGHPGPAFRDDAIVAAWGYNTEHPVLMKTLFGLSWAFFHDTLGWVGHSTAYRLPAIVMAGAMVGLVYLFGTEAGSRRAGLLAAALLATMPRLFHDAHLACFDVPMAAMQLLVVYAYWRGLRSAAWAVACGVLFGLALATKLNAFFIPVFLVTHAAVRAFRGGAAARRPGEPSAALALVSMAVLGPLVFFAHWPYLWHDPLARAADYLRFHRFHEHYPVEYFGPVLVQPPFPWSFVFVMTAVTVPLPTLTLMVVAVVRGLIHEIALVGGWMLPQDAGADDPRLTRLLLLLAGLGPMLVMTLPGVPIFGGVKHWFVSLPFLALLAAAELDRLLERASSLAPSTWNARLREAAAALVVVLPGVLGIRLVHPYGIGFYNELIGSVRGAAEQGMLRNFWGYTSRGLLDTLDREAAPGARVFFHDTNLDSFQMDVREGLLRPDLRYASRVDEAEWAACDQQRAYRGEEYRVWNDWKATRPRAGVYVDEVPMNVLYSRPGTAR